MIILYHPEYINGQLHGEELFAIDRTTNWSTTVSAYADYLVSDQAYQWKYL